MSRIFLENISKIFDNKIIAIDNLSLEIKDGEFFVLVGPSGCGKSTVLRIIAGLEEPTQGKVYIGDRVVNDIAPKDRNVAMVFQNYALYPHMTAFDNMAFGLKLRKTPKSEIHRRVTEAAKILNIEHLLNRKPKALSGGERQRVAVGRAIVRNPAVFLFDEPLSNIDAKLRVQMRAELSQLHQRLKTTTLYVTHDQVEAMTLGQRIGVMRQGKLLQVDKAITLYNEPVNKFVAGFIGSPPINFIDGMIKANHEIKFESSVFSINLPEKYRSRLQHLTNNEVILGIRPEDIYFKNPEGRNLPSLIGELQVIEPMGSETIVYFKIKQHLITARFHSQFWGQIGEMITFYIDTDKIHLFDKTTEIRI
ncbi:MAG: sn-glycerol-3-phosphate ABC transporter ATP-binding protein UgpC [candidate division WOR-3 bacterium]|nr:sn-glycerol-3-phosphate ABC transporter ATP-binding protein UgpC [candidate division WOR-3 bacterium]